MNPRKLAETALLLAVLAVLPASVSGTSIETRITSALTWISSQQLSGMNIAGFAAGTEAPANQTIATADQALITLAVADYHSTHNDDRYDILLELATDFLLRARQPIGEFYEYYDLQTRRWVNLGGLSSWDAYALAGLATAAYKITLKSPQKQAYWASVEAKLRQTVTNHLSDQRSDGAWIFRETGSGRRSALLRENGLMLTALTYIGLFELDWGNPQQATFYAQLSEKTATWLFSQQVTNESSSTHGGFPHSDSNGTQIGEENGIVLLGVNSYYTIISVLERNAKPTIWDARKVMMDWVSGFARRMRDDQGGMYYARNESGIVPYPKTTLAAAWSLQALADIWVNLGGTDYYEDAQRAYDWVVGDNEIQLDLQSAESIAGVPGGFYAAIGDGYVDRSTSTAATAVALYAFNRASFILVPEFQEELNFVTLFAALFTVLIMSRRTPTRAGSQPDSRIGACALSTASQLGLQLSLRSSVAK